jgi:hypothetical protein
MAASARRDRGHRVARCGHEARRSIDGAARNGRLLGQSPAQLGEGLAAFLVERHREGTAGLALANTIARRFEPGANVIGLKEANPHDQPPKWKAPGELISRRISDLSISELLAALQERVNSHFQLILTFLSKFAFRPFCTALDSYQPEQPHQSIQRNAQIADVLLWPVHRILISADDAVGQGRTPPERQDCISSA